MTMQTNQNEKHAVIEIEEDDNGNESTFIDGKVVAATSSLARSINSAPSNGASSSYHINANLDMEHGDNAPQKRGKSLQALRAAL